MKNFDREITTLVEVASMLAHGKHDASLFHIVYTNIKIDLMTLDICIKYLRRSIDEGNKLYGKYVMSYNYLSDFDSQIKGQLSELQTLTTRL